MGKTQAVSSKYLILAANSGFYQNGISPTRLTVIGIISLSTYAKVSRAILKIKIKIAHL